ELGILDWYTAMVGLAAFATLIVHGALWVALRTDGPLEQKSRILAARAWWFVLVMVLAITAVSFQIQPQLSSSFATHPWGYVIPATALAALVLVRVWIERKPLAAFLASSVFIAAMLSSAAFGLYPYVLPSRIDPRFGLTISNAAAAAYGLRIGLAWWIPGILLAIAYFVFTYRRFAGKVHLGDEGY
ncbi:MAG: cytochrome d ubiquinol oxidase, subunit, partial [Bryobacterales bacterium]|nr:cytochrome d ubiquinol oxidase, subunit [Bryobacterales bacterium]